MLLRNPATAQKIAGLIWEHIAVTTDDGIQEDGSFHFHGAQLYTGGYGADEAVQLATNCQLMSGIPAFEPPSDTLAVIAMYLLNGTQYALRTSSNGTYFDLSTKGREITRAPDGNLAFPTGDISAHLFSELFCSVPFCIPHMFKSI